MNSDYNRQVKLNLEAISSHSNFTNWVYGEIKPFVNGDVLEVGSGIGIYSEKLIGGSKVGTVFLSDIDPSYLRLLKRKFRKFQNVRVVKLDLNSDSDFGRLKRKFDSIVCMNVLEHIEEDSLAMKRIRDALRNGGRMVLLVPAHKFLYNIQDKKVGHFRRYTKHEVEEKARDLGFEVERIFYFNFFSIFGWYLYGSILKRFNINEGAFGIFDFLVPLLKFLDSYALLNFTGLSLVVILKKPNPIHLKMFCAKGLGIESLDGKSISSYPMKFRKMGE